MIRDNIYGEVEIEEPVLLELLESPAVLRLRKVSQYGVPDKYYHHKGYSRYDHSIGVMLLLRKIGATLEEQVAGLLHDVSHLAFSHVADWVFSDGSSGVEEFHHSFQEKFIKETEIAKILEKFSFLPDRILNEGNFSLLERKIPDLCADRADYALREFGAWLNPGIISRCIEGLMSFNGELVFSHGEVALDFAANFLELQTMHWGGHEAMVRYYLFSELLKIALERRIISKEDFYQDEGYIINKLENCQDELVGEILTALEKEKLDDVALSSGRRVFKKFRYVDPKVLADGKLIRLSEINPGFKELVAEHRKINRKGVVV